jgi:hypothetical protein
MIIKEKSEVVDTNKIYEIYEEVSMSTPDNKTVTVLQLKETVSLDSLNNEIAQIQGEITNLQARLTDRQTLLEEINNL